jgi:predicted phosphate transport protein (TIGR00153 family)
MIRLATLLRGKDRRLFELFERAGENIHRTAELLDRMLRTFPEGAALAAEIRAREHEGDQITHELIDRMNKTFVTPIEREDVLQLGSALDDVVDSLEEVADFLGLYAIEAPMDQAQQLAEILVRATRELAIALPMLQGFKDIHAQVVEIHRLENEGDTIVRGAIASLFKQGIDPIVVIRWKDIFERLEQAIDSCERAAYILEGIVIKNA